MNIFIISFFGFIKFTIRNRHKQKAGPPFRWEIQRHGQRPFHSQRNQTAGIKQYEQSFRLRISHGYMRPYNQCISHIICFLWWQRYLNLTEDSDSNYLTINATLSGATYCFPPESYPGQREDSLSNAYSLWPLTSSNINQWHRTIQTTHSLWPLDSASIVDQVPRTECCQLGSPRGQLRVRFMSVERRPLGSRKKPHFVLKSRALISLLVVPVVS